LAVLSVRVASADRWTRAQDAERAFWASATSNPETVARTLSSLFDTAAWARGRLGEPPAGDVVDIGCGPLGMSAGALLAPDRRVIGVDPLPLAELDPLGLPAPLDAALRAFRRPGYEHVQAAGESTGLPDRSCALAICHNALDHVRDPSLVLREAGRVLVPGGVLLVSCDVFSRISRLRFRHWTARRRPTSTLVQAHPFRFTADELRSLVTGAGFVALADSEAPEGRRRRALIGHASVLMLLAGWAGP
jgi:SAM-dependent methyltransferase